MARKDTEDPLLEDDLTLFYEVSTSIHSIRDLDEMLRAILGQIKNVFNVEGASLALHDPERSEFFFIRTIEQERNGEDRRMERMRFPDDVGVAAWVLRENRPAIIQDATQDPRFFSGVDLRGDFATRSMICCPLRSRRGPIGVLYALNKREGPFTERDSRLLEILSGTVAIAIENAQLYGEARQQASSLERENRRLKGEAGARFHVGGIIGSSAPMRRLFALLEKVVETDTTVLIHGETGTGKELIANIIHYNGPRRAKPFVAENCGALAEHLLESELFGHVRGAFTGAISDKKGLFELANGGTIFLDEIGEMSPGMQVKLLRVLEEGRVRRVGGSDHKDVDMRIISATNRNLEEEVKAGRFREDLFYRIHVFPITLPPLRERSEDIPLLVNHFLEKYAAKLGRPTPGMEPRALELMTRYEWHGNVRELENEIERAMTLLDPDGKLDVEHLSEKIHGASDKPVSLDALDGTLQEVTERIERQMVTRALNQTNGNRSQAARILGLTRQGLLNKISRYQVEA